MERPGRMGVAKVEPTASLPGDSPEGTAMGSGFDP